MIQIRLTNNIRVWAVLVLLAVFGVGAVCGAAIGHVLWDRRIPPHLMGHLPIHELELTDAQRRQVDEIFETHRPKLDAVLDETFPKVRAVNDKIEKDILGVLNDEQKKRFESLKSRRPPGPHRRAHGDKGRPSGVTFMQPQRAPDALPMPDNEVLPPREEAAETK